MKNIFKNFNFYRIQPVLGGVATTPQRLDRLLI